MTTNGVPNDVINNLDPLALVIFIPITAKWIYPLSERLGYRFTPIRKIFWGFMSGTAAMIWSAVVQLYIYRTSPCGYQANSCVDSESNALPSPLSVWIQSGSYLLIAFSEILASITGLEYAFTKAPKNMRSLVMAFFFFMTALSSAICEAMNPLANDPHLICMFNFRAPLMFWYSSRVARPGNYGAAAIIAFVAGIAFWYCFRSLDKQEDELNMIGTDTAEAMGYSEQPKKPMI